MAPKKRITKHQMKEDQFVTMIFRTREWASEKLNMILIVLGAVILVIAAIWYVMAYGQQKGEDAYDLLGRAEIEARLNQAQLAIIDFQKVIDDYGSSDAAKLAAFKLANLYYEQNDYENAARVYKDYIDNYLIDDISRCSALEGIASSLGNSGKYQEAGDAFLEVARLDTTAVTYEKNLFNAVDNYVKADDRDHALEAFALLEKEGIRSEEFRTAKIILIEKGFLAYDEGEYK